MAGPIAVAWIELRAETLYLSRDVEEKIRGSATLRRRDERVHGQGRRLTVQTDVGDENAVTAMVAQAADAFGGLDLLVHNAGVKARSHF